MDGCVIILIIHTLSMPLSLILLLISFVIDSLFQCGTVYYGIRPIVAMLPAWWRFAQCLRRYRDTRDAHPHLVNAGKYSTSFFVVTFSTIATILKG